MAKHHGTHEKHHKSLTTELRRHIEHLESLDPVSTVSIYAFGKHNGLADGCHYDPKFTNGGYMRGANGIPLILVDRKAPQGKCFVTVYAKPGEYEQANSLISTYVYDGNGQGIVTKDPQVMQHIDNLMTLDEIIRVEKCGVEGMPGLFDTGVYPLLPVPGRIECMIVGSKADAGLKANIVPRHDAADTVRYAVENYRELFF